MVKSSTNQEKCARLSLAEREDLAIAREQGQSMRAIAESPGSPSSISREIQCEQTAAVSSLSWVVKRSGMT
jgi:IS30 family transposase